MTFRVARMSEQESEAWLGLITVCQLLPAALDAQLKQDSQMTHFEFFVLSVLKFSPQSTLRMTALAQTTASTLARLSHVCTRLEKRGLVDRFTCADDGRATNVRLTQEGSRALIAALPGHLATVRRLVIDALTPAQLDALAEITSGIRSRLAGADDWGPSEDGSSHE